MKKDTWIWELIGFAVVSLGGTLLHFLYEWVGQALWAAPFSGVNESTWEHMKLLFWPMLVYAVVQAPFFRERADFWDIKLRGVLIGIGLIPLLFYTYNGVIGKSPDWVNVTIFFVAAAAAYIYEAKRMRVGDPSPMDRRIAIALLCLTGAAFIVFTFLAPRLEIFRDPLTGKHGI